MKHNDNKKTRREFVQQTALAAGGLGLLGVAPELSAAVSPPVHHRKVDVKGIHAYADKLSVAAGDEINFHVSSDIPYSMQIYRLGPDPDTPNSDRDTPNSDEQMSEVFRFGPLQQPIYPGSYVEVNRALTPPDLTPLTLECWVRPFLGRPKFDHDSEFNYTGLITQFDFPRNAGYGLFVRSLLGDFLNPPDQVKGGKVAFYLGTGPAYDKANLLEVPMNFADGVRHWWDFQWHHIVGTWDGRTKALWIDGELAGSVSFTGPVRLSGAPLRLAALGDKDGNASHFLNGDLAMPVIYNRALSELDIRRRYSLRNRGAQPSDMSGVLGCWPLAEEKGDLVADISPFRRSGSIVNHATWQIGGPRFDAGHELPDIYDPAKDPTRGHGLRFSSDDLVDCGWRVTQHYRVPTNARSGIYVARLRYDNNGQPALYHVTFIVRKRDNQPAAPSLLVCPTNTWLAYNSRPFLKREFQGAKDSEGRVFKENVVTDRRSEDSGDDVPEFSCYKNHQNFAPPYHFGRLLPQPAADPYGTYASDDYSHLTRATRFTQVWLEKNKYSYDVITDLDLHTIPGILNGYRTVILAGHSEYWSSPAYDRVKSYLGSGGRLIVLSGNTMYWRVSFDPTGTVMECRKVAGAGALTDSSRGEAWHSDDGKRGGLMRECGFPGWQVCGLETFGILGVLPGGPGNPAFGKFHVTNPEHFLFKDVGVTAGQEFALNMVGHESDVRVNTLEALRIAAGHGVPDGATAPVEPPGITTLAQAKGIVDTGLSLDYFLQGVETSEPESIGDLIYWQRPDGGEVFNASAVGNGIAVLHDPIFDKLMKSVLTNFLR